MRFFLWKQFGDWFFYDNFEFEEGGEIRSFLGSRQKDSRFQKMKGEFI